MDEKLVRQAITFDDVLLQPSYSEVVPSEVNAEPISDGLEYPNALTHHFGTDTVSGNDCDLIAPHVRSHARKALVRLVPHALTCSQITNGADH